MIRNHQNTVLVFLAAILLAGCNLPWSKADKWNVTLNREDKKPYGSYLAFKSLRLYFPEAKVRTLSAGFRYTDVERIITAPNQPSLFIALGLDFFVTDEELKGLLLFAAKGNEVIIFSRSLDDKIEKLLNIQIKDNGLEEIKLTPRYDGSANKEVLSVPWIKNRRFGYQGRSLKGHFVAQTPTENNNKDLPEVETVDNRYGSEHSNILKELECGKPDTIGYVKANPDFLRFKVGKGHISVHSAPLVLSNYFLLQDNNSKYLEALWRAVPKPILNVFWNDYFKRTSESSDLNVLLRYPSTRWAIILAVATLLIYVLFEAKRKQRIIPVITPLENTSVSFVETVGRLYYNQGNHTNLADKIVQHFLEWVRSNYYINTGNFDKKFISQLALKSGLSEEMIYPLVEMINDVNVKKKSISEADLYYLHNTIQQFYKNH
jgi:hypothetical protein